MTGAPLPESITLDITAYDIAEGKRGSCSKCPAALALLRALRDLGWSDDELVALVTPDECGVIFYDGPIDEVRYEPSPALEQFIQRFDGWQEVQPITTVLRSAGTLIRPIPSR